MSVSYGGDSITFADGSVQSGGWNGFRNRIINGAMVIDQRNAGASQTPASTGVAYTTDRWYAYNRLIASKYSVQQLTSNPPAGYTNYLGVTSLSAYSVASGDIFYISQVIEGYNIADLGWGTANAKTVTLSFWVQSSLTGQHAGSIQNSGSARSYPFIYTINSANTWEQKSITIPGDTSGTWGTTNGNGLQLTFNLGTGTSFQGTASAWSGLNNQFMATGSVQVVGTNGATFYITGVQLERGSTASSFEYRPYGTELALCQRYFQVLSNGLSVAYMAGASSTVAVVYTGSLPIPMRTTPTLSNSTAVTINDSNANYTQSAASMSINNGSATSLALRTNNFTSLPQDGRAFQIMTANFAGLSAEL
jgi:hypothetical protein